MEERKEYENCNVYNIAKLFLSEEEQHDLQERYKKGGEGHGHFKVYLAEVILEHFAPYKEKREDYLSHTNEVRDILFTGVTKARGRAMPIIEKVRSVTGLAY